MNAFCQKKPKQKLFSRKNGTAIARKILEKTRRLGVLFIISGFFLLLYESPVYGALKDQIEAAQQKIKNTEKSINDYEVKVSKKQTEIKTLSSALVFLDQNIDKTSEVVKKTEQEIKDLNKQTRLKEGEIGKLEEKLDGEREKLKNFLILANEYDKFSTIEILLKEDNFSDFLNEVESLEAVESNITGVMEDIKGDKVVLEIEKANLEEQIDEESRLRQMKEDELNNLKNNKNIKATLLNQTKGQEKKFQELLKKNQELLPQLREQLLKLQSLGIPINYQDAKRTAANAGQITGVRPAYLLGILKVESDFGSNVGGGNYKRDMAPRQREIFKTLTGELGLDPELMPVSRKPKTYSGWGGAMGPAQMMPETWMLYKSRIAELTGHNPPNPWDFGDAMTAMALKLSGVDGVIGANRDAEYKAAAMYFAGGNWKRFTWYADRVIFYADLYEQYNQTL